MTSEMIKRVAKAIEDADANGFSKLPYWECARAAIEAMREPTVEMLVGAYNAVGVPEKPVLANGYRAMIDAALADPLPVYDRLTDDALGSREVEEK